MIFGVDRWLKNFEDAKISIFILFIQFKKGLSGAYPKYCGFCKEGKGVDPNAPLDYLIFGFIT